jgi:putative endonuclease
MLNGSPDFKGWHIYIIRTRHGHLYTGITKDVGRRFSEHQQGGKKAAKYLRGKGPLKLVFVQTLEDKSVALRAESALKKLSKQDKESLVRIQTIKGLFF